MNKLYGVLFYLCRDNSPIFSNYNYKPTKLNRLNSNKLTFTNNPKGIILSTYFTTKRDPQRDIYTSTDDFNYIKDFYKSIINQNLYAVIFYDALSEDFIEQYSCKNIKFINVNLGPYSLNDERFYIYKEYIEIIKPQKIIMADVNDVIFLKPNIFDFIKPHKFYICKDENYLIYKNDWILNKINNLPFKIKKEKYSFWQMPIVNAGVIGGEYNCINVFLENLIYLFEKVDNDKNNNMILINIIFHDFYWINYWNSIKFKIQNLLNKDWTNTLKTMKKISYKNFHIGFPFTSEFKKEEKNSLAFIKHK